MRLILCGVTTALLGIQVSTAQEPLTLVTAIELPRVEGRIDHLAFDAAGQRLFVAALGNNTVEVIDVKAGKHLKSLPGFHEPQGIAALPDGQGELPDGARRRNPSADHRVPASRKGARV
jgi:DNA-binding beta-propeller fold protein YncE